MKSQCNVHYALTAVHLKNFKTFVGEHFLPTIPRLSFIVGPNGSGKTNIYDAILFATLFPDSRIRLPDDYISSGATGGCWVSLKFSSLSLTTEAIEQDNPGELITFQREYKGNAVEVFKVNGRVCTQESYCARLRDVGVLGQRCTPSIFYVSSDQLGESITAAMMTQYIESASGSSEYTEEYNLLSADFASIDAKIKTQRTRITLLGQRKEVAKKAEEESKRHSELNRSRELFFFKRFLLPLLYYKYHCQLLDPKLLAVNAKLSEMELSKSTLQKYIVDLRNTDFDLAKKINETEMQIAQLDTDLKEAEKEYNNCVLQEQQLNTRIKNAHEQQLTYIERKREREYEFTQIDQTLETIERDLAEVETRMNHADAYHKNISRFLTAEYRKKQDEFSKMKANEYQTINALREKYSKLLIRKEQEQREVDQLAEEQRACTDKCDALTRTQKQYKRMLSELESKVAACNKEIDRLEQQNKDIDKKKYTNFLLLEQLRGKLDTANHIAATTKREEELRLSLKESQDSYPGEVMGLLKYMVTPVKKAHKDILHSALGAYQDGVVCTSSTIAQKCITALKLKMRRPLMFLPMDTLRINDQATTADRTAAARFRQEHPGVDLQPFIEIINVDKTAEKAARFALRNTFYCDSIHEAAATTFAWKDGSGHRVILSSGVQLHPGGIVSCDFGANDTSIKRDEARQPRQKRVKDVPSRASKQSAELETDIVCDTEALTEMTTEEASLQHAKIVQEQDSLMEQATQNMERLQRLRYTDLINYNDEYKRAEKALTMTNSQLVALSSKSASISNSHEQALRQLNNLVEECSKVADELCEVETALWDEKEVYFTSLVKEIAKCIKADSDPSLARLREKNCIYLKDIEEEDQHQRAEAMAQFARLKESKYSMEMRKQLATKVNYSEYIKKLQKVIEDTTTLKDKVIAEKGELDGRLANIKESLASCTASCRETSIQKVHTRERILQQQNKLALITSQLMQFQAQATALQGTQRSFHREILHLCESALMTNTTIMFDNEADVVNMAISTQAKPRFRRKSPSSDNASRCMSLFEECQRLLSSSEEDQSNQIASTCSAIMMLPFSYHLVDPEKQLEQAYTTCLALDDSNYCKQTELLEKQYNVLCNDLTELKKTIDKDINAIEDYITTDMSLEELDKELSKAMEELKSLHNRREAIHVKLTAVTEKRRKLFMDCFTFLTKELSAIYYALAYDDLSDEELPTKVASLTLTKRQTPWAANFIFTVFPPSGYAKEFGELSSGEKSIALLALLFCLHKYKHFPFLLLDEVDKNLDSKNTERLARYLYQTQSLHAIAISHQAAVFSCGDLLIGVTRVRTNQAIQAKVGEKGTDKEKAIGADTTTWNSAEIYLLDLTQYDKP